MATENENLREENEKLRKEKAVLTSALLFFGRQYTGPAEKHLIPKNQAYCRLLEELQAAQQLGIPKKILQSSDSNYSSAKEAAKQFEGEAR